MERVVDCSHKRKIRMGRRGNRLWMVWAGARIPSATLTLQDAYDKNDYVNDNAPNSIVEFYVSLSDYVKCLCVSDLLREHTALPGRGLGEEGGSRGGD